MHTLYKNSTYTNYGFVSSVTNFEYWLYGYTYSIAGMLQLANKCVQWNLFLLLRYFALPEKSCNMLSTVCHPQFGCLVKLRVLSLPLNMTQHSRLLPPGSIGRVRWPPMQQRPGFRGLCRGAKHRSKRLMYSRSYYSVYPLFLSTWTICSLLHWFIWFLWWPVFGVPNLIVWVTGNHRTSWPVHSSQTHTAHVWAESHKEVKVKWTLKSMASMTFFTNCEPFLFICWNNQESAVHAANITNHLCLFHTIIIKHN